MKGIIVCLSRLILNISIQSHLHFVTTIPRTSVIIGSIETRPRVIRKSPCGENILYNISSCSVRVNNPRASQQSSLKVVPQFLKATPFSVPSTCKTGFCSDFDCNFTFDFCHTLPSVLLIQVTDCAFTIVATVSNRPIQNKNLFFSYY